MKQLCCKGFTAVCDRILQRRNVVNHALCLTLTSSCARVMYPRLVHQEQALMHTTHITRILVLVSACSEADRRAGDTQH